MQSHNKHKLVGKRYQRPTKQYMGRDKAGIWTMGKEATLLYKLGNRSNKTAVDRNVQAVGGDKWDEAWGKPRGDTGKKNYVIETQDRKSAL